MPYKQPHKKVYFIDFNTQTIDAICSNIAKLNKNHDALLLRHTNAENLVIARQILRKNKSFCTISHFKNRIKLNATQRNITHLASAKNKRISGESSISFHHIHDISRMQKLRPKIVFLSPVFETKTHPDAKPHGKIGAFKLAFEIKKQFPKCEIYLLGGVNESRFSQVKKLDFCNIISGYGFIRGW